jgi:hypothetical protein
LSDSESRGENAPTAESQLIPLLSLLAILLSRESAEQADTEEQRHDERLQNVMGAHRAAPRRDGGPVADAFRRMREEPRASGVPDVLRRPVSPVRPAGAGSATRLPGRR